MINALLLILLLAAGFANSCTITLSKPDKHGESKSLEISDMQVTGYTPIKDVQDVHKTLTIKSTSSSDWFMFDADEKVQNIFKFGGTRDRGKTLIFKPAYEKLNGKVLNLPERTYTPAEFMDKVRDGDTMISSNKLKRPALNMKTLKPGRHYYWRIDNGATVHCEFKKPLQRRASTGGLFKRGLALESPRNMFYDDQVDVLFVQYF